MNQIGKSFAEFLQPESKAVLEHYTPWVSENFTEGDIFLTQNLFRIDKPKSFIKATLRKVASILGGRYWDSHSKGPLMPVFAVITEIPHKHMHAFIGVHPMDKILGTNEKRMRDLAEEFKNPRNAPSPHFEMVSSGGVIAVSKYIIHMQDNAEVFLEVVNLPIPAPTTSPILAHL